MVLKHIYLDLCICSQAPTHSDEKRIYKPVENLECQIMWLIQNAFKIDEEWAELESKYTQKKHKENMWANSLVVDNTTF